MRADDASFREFVGHSSRRLQHAAELLTGSAYDAQDVVQSVLTRMYPRWDRIRQDDPFGYARRALVNETTDRWRRSRGREVLVARPLEDRDPLDGPAAFASRDAVLAVLSALTDRERVVVVLRYYEDMSEAQIAGVLGIAPGTVKSTANRALSKLRAVPGLAAQMADP